MFGVLDRRPGPRLAARRRNRPRVEGLEDRLLLYAFNGGEWVYGSRITYSFAPDGTNVGGTPSNLDAAMASRGISSQAWRDQFRKAFAAWQVAANINLVEVPDDGSPLSISGNQQGDSRFGDIRIAGIDLGSGVLGLAFLPPPLNGGTLAGDVLLSSTVTWRINSDYDVMTVAVHEIGHALGLGHSTVNPSVMQASYVGVQQTLKTDDIQGIQALYGVRPPDWLEGPQNNNASSRATNITSLIDTNLQARIADLNIATGADTDWYYVVAPSGGSGQITVSMQSTNLSSLGPRVQLFNANLQGMGQSSSNAFGATVTVTANVTPGAGYYIRAMASGGAATAGSYGLIVNFGTQPADPIEPPNTTVPEEPDQGGGWMNLSARLGNHRLHVGSLVGLGDVLTTEDHDHGGGRGRGQRMVWRFGTDTVDVMTHGIDEHDAVFEVPQTPRRRRPAPAVVDALLARGL